ncbi:MAG TPA: response regulator [Vicinamibacterales bacterium]|nr:response regulator [Vicinamibacterales bacterium]
MSKILLVEDNPANADMLGRRLTRRGFQVVNATDGLAAVEQAALERPDSILMDLSLPEIDGLEATRRLKRDVLTASIPVIALTAQAMRSDLEKSLAAGCQEFETKPVDFDRLLRKMGALLQAEGHHG